MDGIARSAAACQPWSAVCSSLFQGILLDSQLRCASLLNAGLLIYCTHSASDMSFAACQAQLTHWHPAQRP